MKCLDHKEIHLWISGRTWVFRIRAAVIRYLSFKMSPSDYKVSVVMEIRRTDVI